MRARLRTNAQFDKGLYTKNKTFSLVISPMAFIDPTFAIITGGIVAVALIEKGLGMKGHVYIASTISTIIKIALPLIAIGSMGYFLAILRTIGGF